MEHYLFPKDWWVLGEVLLAAPLMYALVIIYVRIIGIRSSSQMNSFDWIVTVGIGSIFASTVILEGVTIIAGALGILILLLLQYLLTWSTSVSGRIRKVVKATPHLLLLRGELMEDNMKAERITRSEVLAAIRQSGYKSTENIFAVVLETNAVLSVIPEDNNNGKPFSLSDVNGLPEGLKTELKEEGRKQ